jgi:hypothetical protein
VSRASLAEILDVGRRNGVNVDDELFDWRMDAQNQVPGHAFAAYGVDLSYSRGSRLVPWRMFETAPESGRVRVRLSKRLGGSDDEILAVLIHETDEIAALEKVFEQNGWNLTAERIDSLINERDGTLHVAAWRNADRAILEMIEKGDWPK